MIVWSADLSGSVRCWRRDGSLPLDSSPSSATRPRATRLLIVDDVLTSGGSLLKAVASAREAGLAVTHALVIVDRKEQEGRAKVEQEGVKVISLLTIDDLTAAQERSD